MTTLFLSLRAKRSNLGEPGDTCPVGFRARSPGRGRRLFGAAAIAALFLAAPGARGEDAAALYQAYWAGLPAGEIRLSLRDGPAYRDEIAVRAQGLAWLLTRFRATAVSEGRIAERPVPAHYDAFYDLRKGRDRRLSMQFSSRGGALLAERGAGDTSKKPPLAENFRRNVLDPLSALTAIREELRRGNRGSFTVPVYDGARRFDVNARVLPKTGDAERVLHVELTLSPIAGFKGETSEDGDPDNAPRPVSVTFTDDARLMPLSMRVSVAYLPLLVQLSRWCDAAAPCN